MVSISELRKTISTRKTQASQARQSAQKRKESIPKTTKRQLLAGEGLKGRQKQRGLAKQRGEVEDVLQQVTGFEQETVKAEKQVEAYLRTPSGIMQYAKEKGIKPKPIYGKLARGYSIQVLGYEYDTPYGKVTDWSPKEKQLETERKLAGMASKNIQEMGFASDKAFRQALSEGKLSESQIRKGGINPQALQIQENIRAKAQGATPGKLEVAGMGRGLTILQARDYSAKNLAMRREASGLPTTTKVVRVDKTADISNVRNLQLDSSSKSLNNINASRGDGNTTVLSRVSDRTNGGATSKVRSLITGMLGSSSDLERGKEKGFQEITVGDKTLVAAEQPAYGTGDISPLTGQVSSTRTVVMEKPDIKPTSLGKDILWATTIPATVVSGAAKTAGYWTPKGIEKGFEVLAPEYRGITVKERTVEMTTPQFGSIQTNVITGKQQPFVTTTVTAPEKKVLTPKAIGRVVGVGAQVGTYVAADYFTMGLIDASFISKGGQTLLSKEATKEQKIEGAFELGGGVLGIGIRGVSAGLAKTRLSKVGKYLDVPESRVITSREEVFSNIVRDQRVKPKVKISQVDDLFTFEVTPKVKGKEVLTEILPTGRITGNVVEVRKGGVVGKGIFSQTDEGITETVKFLDDGITRVTNIPKGADEGVVTLLKGDKQILKSKVSPNFLDDLAPGKTKLKEIKIDRASQPTISKTDTEFIGRRTGRTKTTRLETPQGELAVGDNLFNPNSKKVVGDIKISTTTQKDIEKGIFRLRTETTGFTDITEVGARKGMLQAKSTKGKYTLRRQVPQRIEYGIDNSIDVIGREAKGNAQTIKKLISPKVERQVTELAGAEQIDIFLKPGTKEQKAILSTQKAKVQAAKKYAREADFVRDLVDENIVTQKGYEILDTKVGSAGTEGKLSNIGLSSELVVKPSDLKELQNIPTTTYVAPPKLKGLQPTQQADLFTGLTITETTKTKPVSTVAFSRALALDQTPAQDTKIETELSSKPASNIKIDFAPALKDDVKRESKVGQQFKQQFKTSLKQEFKQPQKFREATKSVMAAAQAPRPKKPTPTKILLPTPTTQTFESPREKKVSFKDVFKVFARKGGVDVQVGEASTRKEAFQKLARGIKGTLRASGFVTKGGRKVRPLSFGNEFRAAKADPFRVVQRRGKRLGTRRETSEIQFFKRTRVSQKKKNKKPWGV